MWNGKEEDRATAICNFCDTEFVGTDGVNGGKYSAEELVIQIKSLFPGKHCFVVCTGGEPGLQMDADLIQAMHESNIEIAIETNGTVALPEGIDWITVSPKAQTEILIQKGHELKLVYPQENVDPKTFEGLDFEHFFVQPLESSGWEANTKKTLAFAKANPKWRVSVQSHKYLNIP